MKRRFGTILQNWRETRLATGDLSEINNSQGFRRPENLQNQMSETSEIDRTGTAMSGQHLRTTKSFQTGEALPMKTLRSFGAIFFACCLTFQHLSVAQQASAPSATCQVYFSPRGGANSGIVQTLDKARSSVLVQAYSFTSTTLAEALVRVHKKGINVQVILDKSQKAYKYSTADFLAGAGIPVFIDAVHAIAHNKVMVIDSEIVITGSFNFTKAAEERNAENLLIVRSKELAARYVDNWRIHQRHSTPFR